MARRAGAAGRARCPPGPAPRRSPAGRGERRAGAGPDGLSHAPPPQPLGRGEEVVGVVVAVIEATAQGGRGDAPLPLGVEQEAEGPGPRRTTGPAGPGCGWRPRGPRPGRASLGAPAGVERAQRATSSGVQPSERPGKGWEQGPGHREQPGGQALRGEHGPRRRPAPVEGRHGPAGPAQAPPGRQTQARGRLQKDGRLLIRSGRGRPAGDQLHHGAGPRRLGQTRDGIPGGQEGGREDVVGQGPGQAPPGPVGPPQGGHAPLFPLLSWSGAAGAARRRMASRRSRSSGSRCGKTASQYRRRAGVSTREVRMRRARSRDAPAAGTPAGVPGRGGTGAGRREVTKPPSRRMTPARRRTRPSRGRSHRRLHPPRRYPARPRRRRRGPVRRRCRRCAR